MDRAYGGDATRQLVLDMGFTPFIHFALIVEALQ